MPDWQGRRSERGRHAQRANHALDEANELAEEVLDQLHELRTGEGVRST
jgi:hypothetical protein